MSDNQVTLVGNLTDDPELRYTSNGLPVANFRLAVNQRLWDGDGWKDGEPSFFRVNVWRDQAEHVNQSLRKGARCVVVGRLKSHSWETPEGQRRSAVEVEADDVAASLRFGAVTPAQPAAKADRNGRRAEGEPEAAGRTLEEVPF